MCLHQTVIKMVNTQSCVPTNICWKVIPLFISQVFSACCLVNLSFALPYLLATLLYPTLDPGRLTLLIADIPHPLNPLLIFRGWPMGSFRQEIGE